MPTAPIRHDPEVADAIAVRAALLKRLGNDEPLDVRRAQALGDLARADQPTLDLRAEDDEDGSRLASSHLNHRRPTEDP